MGNALTDRDPYECYIYCRSPARMMLLFKEKHCPSFDWQRILSLLVLVFVCLRSFFESRFAYHAVAMGTKQGWQECILSGTYRAHILCLLGGSFNNRHYAGPIGWRQIAVSTVRDKYLRKTDW